MRAAVSVLARRSPAPTRSHTSVMAKKDPAIEQMRGQLADLHAVISEHLGAMTAAIDALDVKTIATLAALLEVDVKTLETIGSQLGADHPLARMYHAMNNELHTGLPVRVSLLAFRGNAVLSGYELTEYPVSLADYLHVEVPQLLRTIDDARHIVELAAGNLDDQTLAERASSLLSKGAGRPISFAFKKAVMKEFGLWDRAQRSVYGRWMFAVIEGRADRAQADFGPLVDVGEFDTKSARTKLSYYWDDWRISDSEAIDVVKMFDTAPTQAGRDAILGKLLEMGKLGRLASNLPWKLVQQLHDATTDQQVRAALLPYFKDQASKEPGESLAHMYDRWGLSQARKANESSTWYGALGHGSLAYGAAFLHTAHNALTFGFLDTYSEAYDLHEQGLISDDAFAYTSTVALARSAAVLAASVVTGGTASGFSSGLARGLGMSRGGAAIVGNLSGGVTAGVGGLFSADLVNIAFLDQQGLSAASDYLTAAGIGGALGGVGSIAEAKFPASARATAELYADRYPWLRNLVETTERVGVKTGNLLRPAASPGTAPFPKTWGDMSRAEREAFQHEYSRHAKELGLPNWSQTNAEALRGQFNAKAAAIRDGAMYSVVTRAPRGVRGSGVPAVGTDVRMYVSSDGTSSYFYYETLDAGEFVSAGRINKPFTPGSDDLLPGVIPPQDRRKP